MLFYHKHFVVESTFTSYLEKGNMKCFYCPFHGYSLALYKLIHAMKGGQSSTSCGHLAWSLFQRRITREAWLCIKERLELAHRSRQKWEVHQNCLPTRLENVLRSRHSLQNERRLKEGIWAAINYTDGRKTKPGHLNQIMSTLQSDRDLFQESCHSIAHQRISKSHEK